LTKVRLSLLGPLPEPPEVAAVPKNGTAVRVASSDSGDHGEEEDEALEIEIVGAGDFLTTGSAVKGDMSVLFTRPSCSTIVLEKTTFSGVLGHGAWPSDIEVRSAPSEMNDYSLTLSEA
jgi:hypothetical protein